MVYEGICYHRSKVIYLTELKLLNVMVFQVINVLLILQFHKEQLFLVYINHIFEELPTDSIVSLAE